MAALNKHLANVTAYVTFLQALHSGGTTRELIQETGLNASTVKKFIAVARRKGCVYAKSWEKDLYGRNIRAVWAWGEKPDAPKPPAMTATERSRLARARQQSRAMQFLKATRHGKSTGNSGTQNRRAPSGKQVAEGADSQHQQVA